MDAKTKTMSNLIPDAGQRKARRSRRWVREYRAAWKNIQAIKPVEPRKEDADEAAQAPVATAGEGS